MKALRLRCKYLTKERYIDLYSDSCSKDLEPQHFENLAGKGANQFPLEKIDQDIHVLLKGEVTKKVTTYRDQYVAHLDKFQNPGPFFYQDLFDATEEIERIIKKYELLLTASALMGATPTIQGDWQEPLRHPLLIQVDDVTS